MPQPGIKCWVRGFKGFCEDYLKGLFGSEVCELTNYSVLICSGIFTEAYLLSSEVLEVVNVLLRAGRVPYSAGIYVGRVRRSPPRLIPSADFLGFIYEFLGSPRRAFKVSWRGIKPFLYGRDILKSSVIKCFDPVSRGEVAAVLGEDGLVYGVGISEVDGCDSLKGFGDLEVVVKNVFDVGWFLRSDSERKFKVSD